MLEGPRLQCAERARSRSTEADALLARTTETGSARMAGRVDGSEQDRVVVSLACQDFALGTQEPGDSMRRKRFQKGSVRPRKHGRTKVWVAQWAENGGNRSKVLGRVADMAK